MKILALGVYLGKLDCAFAHSFQPVPEYPALHECWPEAAKEMDPAPVLLVLGPRGNTGTKQLNT